MSEEIKFNDEELQELKKIQDSYLGVQNNFGQLKMAMFRLEQQEVDLEDKLKAIQENEDKFLNKITDKYGQGTLNPETGVFTPNKSE
jgi:hypothetical protein